MNLIEWWTIIGGIVFGLSCILISNIPESIVRYFVVSCGPIAWLVMYWKCHSALQKIIKEHYF